MSEIQPSSEVVVKEDKSKEELQLANFTLKLSESWKQEQPGNRMRVAQLYFVDKPEIKMAVFFFGEQDMKEENIERWKNQYTMQDSYNSLNVESELITAIKITGTYKKKAFPMAQDYTEAPDYGTLAAIVPSDKGPFYFKLTAPEDFINKQEEGFIEMLNSYTKI